MFKQPKPSEIMSAEMREIVSHAQSLVEATAGEVDERISKVRAELQARLASAKEKYGEMECCLKDKVQAADEIVREKPYHAMGATFVVGLVLGWLVNRR